ncbi:MAG TPA: XrtA/PEP-CTERM system histidine kinase PrsK [Burkholderiales bacterium]|nr:XrtA/PEP-CTERM system histidine kinase PrsK [Burkholderiales bacterium]
MLDFAVPGPAAACYGLATLAFSAFAVHLALGHRGSVKAAVLLLAMCLSALWSGLNLAFAISASSLAWSTQALTDGLRQGTWLVFGLLVLGTVGWRGLTIAGALVLSGAVFLLQEPIVASTPVPAFVSRAPFGVLLAFAIAGLVLAEQIFRRAGAESRWALKPLCLALGASFVFDLYVHADALLFGRLDAHVWAARGVSQALVIPLIALATARNRDWTIDIAFSRGVVFHSAAFAACGAYLLGVAGAGYYVRYFGGSWGRTFQIGFIFAALLVLGWLFSSGTLRAKLKVFISKNFFSYRYDYRHEWLRFTNLLSAQEPGVSTAQRSIEALANLVESPAGALWLRDAENRYTPAARWNLPQFEQRLESGHALGRFLERTGWVIDLAEYRQKAAKYAGLEIPAWLLDIASGWLLVPIIAQEQLIGFVVLATPRTKLDVNWEVLDLLKTAARQIGSFLAHIQASESLLEARKFEAFNKMGAFVVHDLKNLVAQLSLLLTNAERHRQNPRFQEDMLATVKHVAERMNRLLVQLSTGSRSEEALRPLNLGALAKRVVQSKRNGAAAISLQDAGEVFALGYEQRLERVIGHLVQNAIDATHASGTVQVDVVCNEQWATVEVCDNGCGMSEAFVRERLFRPFQTTKASGMGIGAFETAQYAKETGGRVEAQSRPGEGTRIKLVLPRYGDAASETHAREAA